MSDQRLLELCLRAGLFAGDVSRKRSRTGVADEEEEVVEKKESETMK